MDYSKRLDLLINKIGMTENYQERKQQKIEKEINNLKNSIENLGNNNLDSVKDDIKRLKNEISSIKNNKINNEELNDFKKKIDDVNSAKIEMDLNEFLNKINMLEDKISKIEYVVTRMYESYKR
jgi:chromosome segregation ATPase